MTDDTCRLCLSKDIVKRHEIFQKDEHGVSLSVKIMLCSSLTVSDKDLLPKFICNHCFSIIDVFYDFRELCIQNYRKLVNCLNENEIVMEAPIVDNVETEVISMAENIDDLQVEALSVDKLETDQESTMDLLRVYQCTNCNSIFETVDDIEKHVCHLAEVENKESVKDQYKCSFCNRQYKSKSQVRLHEKVHKGTQPHKCSHCDKSFLRPSDKVKHERTHTGECPFSCDICNKSFKQIAGLIVHERNHTGHRPYKCSTCHRSFTQDGTLKKHERVHAGGKKPFVCDFKSCGRAFTCREECDMHVRVHFGEKPHICLICSSSFKKPSELESHIKRCHKGEFLYKCMKCDKEFVNAYRFNLHVHCPFCNDAFDKKIALQQHVLEVHPDENI